jgi:hypothetical protein
VASTLAISAVQDADVITAPANQGID